jgi:hypothetical protein
MGQVAAVQQFVIVQDLCRLSRSRRTMFFIKNENTCGSLFSKGQVMRGNDDRFSSLPLV